MKLAWRDFATHLKGNLRPAYWISGDDVFLCQKASENLRKVAKQQGFTERHIFVDVKDVDRETLLPVNLSLFAETEKSIIEVYLTGTNTNATFDALVAEYVESSQKLDTKLLIIHSPKLAAKQLSNKAYKSVSKHAVHLEIWPLPAYQIQAMLRTKLDELKLKLDNHAFEYILNIAQDTGLNVAMQQIEKLQLHILATHHSIAGVNDLLDISVPNNNMDIFVLLDAIFTGKLNKVLQLWQTMTQQNFPLTMMLWWLCKELRLIYVLLQEKNQYSWQELCKKHRLFSVQSKRLQTVINVFTEQKCLLLLERAAYVDKAIKGAFVDQEPSQTLRNFIVKLTVIASKANNRGNINA
ncbi:MAG: DNA polymerase III subunit delta [Thiotrichales bacterium]|nr:MAG: DNA polymerase III subunit delta [Thiotrichales bacterium]